MLDFAVLSSDLPPTIAAAIICLIPIVALLTRHQQKMAMILGRPTQGQLHDEAVMQLAAEVRELRVLVAQQTLALDNISDTNRRLATKLEEQRVIA